MVSPNKPASKSVSVGDFGGVIKLFDAALNNGLQHPKIRLQKGAGEKIVLSVAGPSARFPGTINVTDGGPFGASTFYGRVTREGEFQEQNSSSEEVRELLRELATHPKQTARAYGKKTGNCCCCGRKLTDPISVMNGIGPICEGKFGM